MWSVGEEEGRKTAVNRKFEVVAAELRLDWAGICGDEEEIAEQEEVSECGGGAGSGP